jgi:hypothetical protein
VSGLMFNYFTTANLPIQFINIPLDLPKTSLSWFDCITISKEWCEYLNFLALRFQDLKYEIMKHKKYSERITS